MPIISSMSTLSARGYGQFGQKLVIVPPIPGTQGVFYLSSNSVNTNKYKFAPKTMVVGALLKATILQGAATGNSNLMLGMGQTNSAMQKYIWAGDKTVVGPALAVNISLGGGASNANTAIFHRGRNGNTTAIYSYADDTLVEGPVSVTSGRYMAVAGNASQAVFKINGAITNRYTYSDSVWVAAGSLTDSQLSGSAVGVAEYGIFAIGAMLTKSNKYVYATDIVTVATAFKVALGSGCAIGNDTSGLYATGANNSSIGQSTTSEYSWADDVTTVGTSLTAISNYTGGSGNGTTGVNIA